MKRGFNKKGAIELSITTIIVIVLGVTLLVLGLVFVKGIFSKVNALSDQAFSSADKAIKDNMGANQKVYVQGQTFDVNSGESTTINIGVQNFGTERTPSVFTVGIEPGSVGGDKSWFLVPDKGVSVDIGDKKGIPVLLTLPKNIEPGSAFTFTINIKKGNELYGSEAIIVKAKK